MLDAIVYIALLVTVWNLGRASLRAEIAEKQMRQAWLDKGRYASVTTHKWYDR